MPTAATLSKVYDVTVDELKSIIREIVREELWRAQQEYYVNEDGIRIATTPDDESDLEFGEDFARGLELSLDQARRGEVIDGEAVQKKFGL